MRTAEEIGPGTDCATEPAGRRPTMTRWLTFLLALAGARHVQSRMSYLPDEPPQPGEQGKPAESGS